MLVGESCLLLNNTLLPTELGNCSKISLRAYGTFDHLSSLTGANTLDVAKIGIDNGLLVLNQTMSELGFVSFVQPPSTLTCD